MTSSRKWMYFIFLYSETLEVYQEKYTKQNTRHHESKYIFSLNTTKYILKQNFYVPSSRIGIQLCLYFVREKFIINIASHLNYKE